MKKIFVIGFLAMIGIGLWAYMKQINDFQVAGSMRFEGLQQDVEKGIKMLNEIAESSAFAAQVLGDTYYLDEFIEPDIDRAIIFYKKACKKESWLGCTGLGDIYAYGFDYGKDVEIRRNV